jgi:hypothetical protein
MLSEILTVTYESITRFREASEELLPSGLTAYRMLYRKTLHSQKHTVRPSKQLRHRE